MTEKIRDCWGTPQRLFDNLHKIYGFTVDACADDSNYKMASFFTNMSESNNGLTHSWSGLRIWCNPPYSAGIGDWLAKGREADLAVYLLPSRTDQRWFHDHAMRADLVMFIQGRVQFEPPEGIAKSSNREGSILVCYGREFGCGSVDGAKFRSITYKELMR